ncbi:glycoside hydrolase family 31 protein [Sediminibacillus halophilus]|uniref:Alpha-glucosidase n=1 Tax=Sediminibacillus halophilus TaxID=482461 RepID=A0A1G9W3Y0_9BACI|nr:glycoside hydrolase family 31 protein [Sediminibacillus halophilus]SDM79003.1 alpha-glucosidase [Sediminibacillus halophilus]
MLEDSSFAIHPGSEQQSEAVVYRDIGAVKELEKENGSYQFVCANGRVAIRFYTESIVRIVMNPKGEPIWDKTRSVVAEAKQVNVEENDTAELYELKTTELHLSITKSPFRISLYDRTGRELVSEAEHGMAWQENGEVAVCKQMQENDHFYGFGEKAGFLDKRGEMYEMWNMDVYAPHNPETDPLYESIPYFMTLRNGKAHGIFFDNTYRSWFDMRTFTDRYVYRAEGGQLDYYVMAGPDPKHVLEQYTYLTGRMPLPPKWAIGYHQSRYSYQTEEEVRDVAQHFIDRNIPIDVLHLDIHYMNGYRVFTFDEERFPNPEKLVQDLNEMGIRVVPIVDPGVKKDPEYPTYQEGVTGDLFCKYLEGDIYFGDVWPGTSAFPDFTDEKARKWWGEKHRFYTNIGVEGIWNDMNEPAVFNETKTMDVQVMHRNDGSPATHRELHNLYGMLMGKATYEGLKNQLKGKRPFLLTRAGFAGIQRYAAVWTGDNRSFWEHLQMSLPMVMNLGLSGIAFTGPDVGGFAHHSNGELLTRWTQVGAFTPFFRNHSAIGFLYQEPWRFGEKYEAVIKEYIEMRYRWMPQLYSLFAKASSRGLPVMRPLFMEFPDDEKTYNLNDQFMIGDNVIVAPILAPAVVDRAVYLPEGEWIEVSSGKVYQGKSTYLVHAELEDLPLFIKKGTTVMQTDWTSNKDKSWKRVRMDIYAGDKGEHYRFTYYDDDGESFAYQHGSYLELEVEVVSTEEAVKVDIVDRRGDYVPAYQQIDIHVIGRKDSQDVILNGEKENGNNYLSLTE